MTKGKKIALWISLILIAVLLLAYLLLGLLGGKPGMSGFTVMHGTIRLYANGKDYVEIDENMYLYKDGALHKIIENEYESYRFLPEYDPADKQLSDLKDSTLYKEVVVSKDGKEFEATGFNVGLFGDAVNSLCYVPHEEK